MLRIINSSASVVWSFRSLDLLAKPFDCVSDFHERSFQISPYWNSRFLQIYFKFCHIHGIEVAFILSFPPFGSWNYYTFKDLKQRENYIRSNRKTNLKTSYMCSAWLTRMSELSRFVYIISHMKSNAKKVNWSTWHERGKRKFWVPDRNQTNSLHEHMVGALSMCSGGHGFDSCGNFLCTTLVMLINSPFTFHYWA